MCAAPHQICGRTAEYTCDPGPATSLACVHGARRTRWPEFPGFATRSGLTERAPEGCFGQVRRDSRGAYAFQ